MESLSIILKQEIIKANHFLSGSRKKVFWSGVAIIDVSVLLFIVISLFDGGKLFGDILMIVLGHANGM